ncbi:MAG: hypothetical protein CV088_15050 [Nitrospira sp. LK70]|nr:hypothetical protein [Nitrospira sp. LK70]
MIQRIEQRLKELKGEFEAGQKVLADLETRQANVKSRSSRPLQPKKACQLSTASRWTRAW